MNETLILAPYFFTLKITLCHVYILSDPSFSYVTDYTKTFKMKVRTRNAANTKGESCTEKKKVGQVPITKII